MTDEVDNTAEEVEEQVEDTEEDIREILKRIEDDITGIRIDVDSLKGDGASSVDAATPPAADSEAGSTSAGVKTEDNPDTDKEDDPYLRERRPVRRHGLFRRLFN